MLQSNWGDIYWGKGMGVKPLNIESLYGGAERDRTVDLMTASHALSQLSYSPFL